MRICAIGDPHGDLVKIRKIPLKDIDLILLTGDLGKADLARNRFFENIRRKKERLPELEVDNNYRKREYMEAYDSAIEVVKYLAKIAPVYLIFGNADSSNFEVRRKSKKIGKILPFLANDLRNIPNVRIINNRLTNFRGLKIGGLEYFVDTNWVKEFRPSDYDKALKSATRETEKASREFLIGLGNIPLRFFFVISRLMVI